MRIAVALDQLIELEERVGRLYTQFYGKWSDVPAVGGMWWEMALEEHEHAGVLKMVRELTHPEGQVADIRHRLRPLQAMIRKCEQVAAGLPARQQGNARRNFHQRSRLRARQGMNFFVRCAYMFNHMMRRMK